MTISTPTIGFIGLGRMGQPMARNLLSAGFRLRVYNRTEEKTAAFVDAGAVKAQTPAEVLEPGAGEGIVITMVSDDAALKEVVLGPDGLASADAHTTRGMIHISMSTVSPATTRRLAALHEAAGGQLVSAPVFGRPEAAAARKLSICCSGPADAKAKVRPILEALSAAIYDFGDDPGAANIVKLSGNFMLIAATEAFAEALAFAQRNGVPREKLAEMLTQTLFNCPLYQSYGRQLVSEDYGRVGFRLSLALKDLNLALQAADTSQVAMPLASTLHDRLLASVARDRGQLDLTALGQLASDDAGLKQA